MLLPLDEVPVHVPLRRPRWHPNSPPRPGEAPHPAPSARKSATQTAQKTALCAPWEHPGGFGIRKSASNSGHSPLRGLGGGLGDASPARRGSRSRTASPPAPLAIRKAPSASVESIEPRPPRPCEVGRPKGRRRKNRRQSHKFFKHRRSGWHPNSPPRPGGAPHPAPSARKSATQTAQKTALCAPCEHPGGSESENRPATRGTAHSEVQGDARGTARCTTRPMPPFTFCCPQAIVDEEAGV